MVRNSGLNFFAFGVDSSLSDFDIIGVGASDDFVFKLLLGSIFDFGFLGI